MSVREKTYKNIPIEFSRHELKYLKNDDVIATYTTRKPANLLSKDGLLSRSIVRLDLTKKEDVYQFEVMHNIRHRNVLHLEAIEEVTVTGQTLNAVFVEPHIGSFLAYLNGLDADLQTFSLPSQCLREAIRQIILGLEALRLSQYYHGNLSVDSLYVSMEHDVAIIKFAKFCEKDKDTRLETAQLLDWVGLGNVIAQISRAAKSPRNLNINLSFAVIDHLASKLQALTDEASLPHLKNDILNDPFFWDPRKRAKFYIHDLQIALNDNVFVARVGNYIHWQLPWDSDPIDGVLAAMNDYRDKTLKKKAYNGMDPLAYVKCMSGAYTHQEELVGKIFDSAGNEISVDTAIQKNRPELCLTLYRLLTGEVSAAEEAAAAATEEAAAAAAEEAVVVAEEAVPAIDADMDEDVAN